jgi:hypothetical protein
MRLVLSLRDIRGGNSNDVSCPGSVHVIVATVLAKAPTVYAQAPAQSNDHVSPIVAGAHIGATASLFRQPLIVSATAAVATTGGPVVAVIGAAGGGG